MGFNKEAQESAWSHVITGHLCYNLLKLLEHRQEKMRTDSYTTAGKPNTHSPLGHEKYYFRNKI